MLMSDSMSIRPRPGLATRAKNANQRPGRILINSRRTRRKSAQVASSNTQDGALDIGRYALALDRIAPINNAEPERYHARSGLESMTAIEQQESDSFIPGNHILSGSSPPVSKRTNTHSTPTFPDSRTRSSTTSVPQMYDIVTIAQMVLAGLVVLQGNTRMECITDVEHHSYVLHSYYSH